MNCSVLKRWLLIAGMALAAGTTGHAQMKSGQRIVFSPPDSDVAATNTVSLTPRSPELSAMANAIKPSPLNLNFSPAQGPASPMPRPVPISPQQIEKMRQATDKQKNWALMTPAEIMGVPTAEQIMGVPERDANGLPKPDTAEDRYLAREKKANNDSRTNRASAFGSQDNDLNVTKADERVDFFGRPINAPPRPAFSVFDNDANGSRGSAGLSGSGNGSYSAYDTRATPTPDQVAAAKEFERLLQPTAMMQPAKESSAFPAQSQASAANRSTVNTPILPFTPANDSAVGTPIGVKSLLSTTDQKADSTAPVWKPQLPPWMSTAPQPGMVPQRKF